MTRDIRAAARRYLLATWPRWTPEDRLLAVLLDVDPLPRSTTARPYAELRIDIGARARAADERQLDLFAWRPL